VACFTPCIKPLAGFTPLLLGFTPPLTGFFSPRRDRFHASHFIADRFHTVSLTPSLTGSRR
jgi:hypothetical protein